MSWLDHVIAVPAVGILTDRSFARIASAQSSISRLLDGLTQDEGELSIQASSPWEMDIRTPGGFLYKIRPDNLIVQFQYGLTSETGPHELPALEVKEERPFGELLGQSVERLSRLLTAIASEEMQVVRIGVMATTTLKRDEPPPGVEAIIQHLAKPFSGPLIKCNSTLTAVIGETDSAVDRCHHIVAFDDTQGSAIQFRLDWQRVMMSVAAHRRNAIVKLVTECEEKAIGYFESVAEGELNLE